MSTPGLVIAHRAANSPEDLRRLGAHADVVEADVHLYRGRLEVRHAKTLGPLPVLWEKWYLLPLETPRPLLADVLPLVGEDVALMLDLKGPDPRMAAAILRATREIVAARGLIVSGRVWRTIDHLRGTPGVRTLHSVGSPRGLRALLRRGDDGFEGVSIHRRLLSPAVVARLRDRADHVWSWPVDDPRVAEELGSWGVTGFISDAPQRLRSAR